MIRYIRIRLLDVSFWGLPEINVFLHGKDISPIIDLAALEKRLYDIIEKSYKSRYIELLDLEGNILQLTGKTISIDSSICDIDDIEEEVNDNDYNIVSVTVSDEAKEKDEPSIEDYEKAEVILSKNGNTIKKIIKNIAGDTKLLIALKEIEEHNKNRNGVICGILEKIGEQNA